MKENRLNSGKKGAVIHSCICSTVLNERVRHVTAFMESHHQTFENTKGNNVYVQQNDNICFLQLRYQLYSAVTL